MDDDFEVPPVRATIPLDMTVPMTTPADLGEGDLIIFPTADRIFRVGEVLEDGSYGGDICLAGNLNYLLGWEWYTPDEMVSMGMRIFKPILTAH